MAYLIPTGNPNDMLPASIPLFVQGLLADLPALTPGQFYFATDVNILYGGTPNGGAPTTALPLAGPAADIPEDSPAGMLYFATDTQVLYVALGEGNCKVAPTMLTGNASNVPNPLPVGIFYFATDTNELYIGTNSTPEIVGPSASGSAVNLLQVTVDFGSDSGRITRAFDAQVLVSASWVTNSSIIVCSPAGVTTAQHGQDDGLLEGITAQAESLVSGTGFTLHAYSSQGSFGKYIFNCIGV